MPTDLVRAWSWPWIVATAALLSAAACTHVARKMMVVQMIVSNALGPAQIEITISRAFIERYRNRVTMTTDFIVDAAARDPNGDLFDGDLHVAGRSPEIGLPVVIEVLNAASQQPARDYLHRAEGTGKAIVASGVWRIWPEHPGDGPERPVAQLVPLQSPYVSHVFELHPIIRLGNQIELLDSFVPGKRYLAGSGRRTFEIFETANGTLRLTPNAITLATKPGLYNDVHFVMELLEDRQIVVPDGRFVMVRALEPDGTLVVKRLRTVFVKGTPPERAVQGLKPGGRLHVWGLPRINYDDVARRVDAARRNPAELDGSLPYEIVVLGVYP